MSMDFVDNADLTAWLCTHLPRLSDAADQHRWAHQLAAALADIRVGTPAAQALADHHLPVDVSTAAAEQARITRGEPGVIEDLKIDPITVTGPYTCPADPPCGRRAQRDAQGHEPRCGVRDRTMILRGQ
jgi:hypothetical protein